MTTFRNKTGKKPSMREVQAFIELQKNEFANHEIFQYMADEQIEPIQRLSFAPCAAFFVMSFSDLNRHVFRVEPAGSKIQEYINKHTFEDEQHWKWFLQDLEVISLKSPANSFKETLRFLWGPETSFTRQLIYRLTALYAQQTNPSLRLAIIEVVETTGHVMFRRSAAVADQIPFLRQAKTSYFARFHLERETCHLIAENREEEIKIHNFIANIELDIETRNEAFRLVTEVFDAFGAMATEFMHFIHAQKHDYDSHLRTSTATSNLGSFED